MGTFAETENLFRKFVWDFKSLQLVRMIVENSKTDVNISDFKTCYITLQQSERCYTNA